MKTLLIVLISLASTQAFGKLVGPYPDSTDFPNLISQAFKKLTGMEMISSANIPVKCKAISVDNKTALADFDVLTGFPYASSISPSFWSWYYECIEVYSLNTIAVSEAGFKKTLGVTAAQFFSDKSLIDLKSMLWQNTPKSIRSEIIKSILNTLIRDDLLAEFGAQPQQITSEIETVLNHPSRASFKIDQALIVILQSVFKQKSFILE